MKAFKNRGWKLECPNLRRKRGIWPQGDGKHLKLLQECIYQKKPKTQKRRHLHYQDASMLLKKFRQLALPWKMLSRSSTKLKPDNSPSITQVHSYVLKACSEEMAVLILKSSRNPWKKIASQRIARWHEFHRSSRKAPRIRQAIKDQLV